MNIKDFPHVSPNINHDPPRRAISRDHGGHNVTTMLLGCVMAAAVFAVLWGLYAYG